MPDLRWQSMGGTLVDGNGDLAVTLSPQEELQSMAYTRLKAALNAWKSYPGIGAGLNRFLGSSIGINQDTQLSVQRAVTASFTNQFLPPGSFTVQTIPFGNRLQVLVYVGNTLLASTTMTV